MNFYDDTQAYSLFNICQPKVQLLGNVEPFRRYCTDLAIINLKRKNLVTQIFLKQLRLACCLQRA
jgi:hypothetical protein